MRASAAFALLAIPLFPMELAFAQLSEPVDLELVIAVDVSMSMREAERIVQRRGYAEAFREPQIIEAITSGVNGAIAVAYLEWAGQEHATVRIPWTRIDSRESALEYAEELEGQELTRVDRTSLSNALRVAGQVFSGNGWRGTRRVIDISGDGPNNQGAAVAPVRDRLVALGVVINGLPIMVESDFTGFNIDNLDAYFRECVTGGPGSFVIAVRDWRHFGDAVKRKLYLEIAGAAPAPPPAVPASAREQQGEAVDCMIGEKVWREFMKRFNFTDD
jgi:hypothetical protein